MHDVVESVHQKVARKWLGGIGKDAKFANNSEGWYATFKSCPASIYLGTKEPELQVGDRVRITLERRS
jgi:hypothetical protein